MSTSPSPDPHKHRKTQHLNSTLILENILIHLENVELLGSQGSFFTHMQTGIGVHISGYRNRLNRDRDGFCATQDLKPENDSKFLRTPKSHAVQVDWTVSRGGTTGLPAKWRVVESNGAI